MAPVPAGPCEYCILQCNVYLKFASVKFGLLQFEVFNIIVITFLVITFFRYYLLKQDIDCKKICQWEYCILQA